LIARYKAAKKAVDGQNYAEGATAGRMWATSDPAPYVELSNLNFAEFEKEDYDCCDFVTTMIRDDANDDDDNPARSFWESALGNDWPRVYRTPKFLRGFCEGALEVWSEVEPHLV
jgi:hypothetical protein